LKGPWPYSDQRLRLAYCYQKTCVLSYVVCGSLKLKSTILLTEPQATYNMRSVKILLINKARMYCAYTQKISALFEASVFMVVHNCGRQCSTERFW